MNWQKNRRALHLLLVAGLLLPAGLSAQGSLRRERPPTQQTKEELLPPFCLGEHGRNPGQVGHPKFGEEWCRSALETADIEDPYRQMLAKNDAGIMIEPWCRTGEGHPEFGMFWCQKKQEMRAGRFTDFQQVLDGAARQITGPQGVNAGRGAETFCYMGIGHPQFGMEWCTLSQDAWARRQERARDERVGGGRLVP